MPLLPVVELRYASAHQLESLSRWQAEPALEALTPVLCHEPTLLDLTGEILLNSRGDPADVTRTFGSGRTADPLAGPLQRRAVYPAHGSRTPGRICHHAAYPKRV
jgi:hypothetical protein